MRVHVVYLAWLRERAGMQEEVVEVPDGIETVGGLVDWLRDRGGRPASAFAEPDAVRAAVNQRLARPDASVRAGDEIAFFPPVTGG